MGVRLVAEAIMVLWEGRWRHRTGTGWRWRLCQERGWGQNPGTDSSLSPGSHRAAAKPGVCPMVLRGSLGPCLELCDTDSDCIGDNKCCTTGCGHICKPPTKGKPSAPCAAKTPVAPPYPVIMTLPGAMGSWGPSCCPMGQELGEKLVPASRAAPPSWRSTLSPSPLPLSASASVARSLSPCSRG